MRMRGSKIFESSSICCRCIVSITNLTSKSCDADRCHKIILIYQNQIMVYGYCIVRVVGKTMTTMICLLDIMLRLLSDCKVASQSRLLSHLSSVSQ